MKDVCNYVNYTTFHACELDFRSIITRLDVAHAIKWFESN